MRRTAWVALVGTGLSVALINNPLAAHAATDDGPGSLADHTIGSTIAPNGDNNPHSLSVVPANYSGGPLTPGDVLVGDVNNAAGVQDQGRTILAFHNGTPTGFSTAATAPIATVFNANGSALWVAAFGPADNGTAGSIAVLHGTSTTATPTPVVAGTPFAGGVIPDSAGPWGLEFNHTATAPAFFWSNADGTIIRDSKLGMSFASSTATKNVQTPIAHLSFNPARSFSQGTVVAPQGTADDAATDTHYVADSQSDEVVALPGANTATAPITPTVILRGGPLHTPQGLAIDPDTGNLLVVNGAVDNNLIELSTEGRVTSTRNLDPTRAPGALFGLTTTQDTDGDTAVYYVNDNTLHQLTPNNQQGHSNNHQEHTN